jgi:S-adenosyl-L-methionine hydrolase (adenosine-forming)
MSIITLTTDFGYRDGFVGTVKGVILGIVPEVQLIDLTNSISPQNILEGAMALWRAAPFFPAGTVHLAVVDPGVGTQRRPLAARIGDQFFVGPDNGIFTPLIEDAEKKGEDSIFINLNNPKYFLPKVSYTFHGRDIFGPIAAHLAKGVKLESLGDRIMDPVRIIMPKPEKTNEGWIAHITVVDVFGNLTTDLPASDVLDKGKVEFTICGKTIYGLVESYGKKHPGDLIALVDSENFVELATVNGSAARTLNANVGDLVVVKKSA